MKVFACLVAVCLAASVTSLAGKGTSASPLEGHEEAIDNYLDLMATQFVDDIITKNDQKHAGSIEAGSAAAGRRLGLVQSKPEVSLTNVKMHPRRLTGQERKLYESLTASYLLGNGDDTTTTNQLSLLMSQQKSMQNMRTISAWLNDIDSHLDTSRDALNRRMSDLAVGLQRRNMLLSHYNNLGMVSRMGG